MTHVSASEFKAKCLAILDRVARTGERIVILKRGKPVAQLGPALANREEHPQDALLGSVQILGDVKGPVLAPEEWEAESAP
jgi:prevent-host-death family protein